MQLSEDGAASQRDLIQILNSELNAMKQELILKNSFNEFPEQMADDVIDSDLQIKCLDLSEKERTLLIFLII